VDVHDQRLFAGCVSLSILVHGAVLAFVPLLHHAPELEAPPVLTVVLREPAPEPQEHVRPAPPPPMMAPRPPRKTATRSTSRLEALPLPKPSPAPETPAIAPQPSAPPAAPEEAASASVQRLPAAPAPGAVDQRAEERASSADFRAAYLRNPPPAYPASARRNGEAGTVTLRVLVSAEGRPEQVELERSSGSNALDLAALQGVRQWRFAPARRGGVPHEAWVLVPIVFRLEPGA
jgi:periplasmic protein TonB